MEDDEEAWDAGFNEDLAEPVVITQLKTLLSGPLVMEGVRIDQLSCKASLFDRTGATCSTAWGARFYNEAPLLVSRRCEEQRSPLTPLFPITVTGCADGTQRYAYRVPSWLMSFAFTGTSLSPASSFELNCNFSK